MKKLLLSLLLAQFAFNFTFAQTYTNNIVLPNGGKMPPGIHVDGNYLKDDAGNKVVLHGYMDTPSPWFNSNRWGTSSTDGNLRSCIYYFAKLFKATTNPEKGTYCNIFRLHLDPCWTNDPNKKSTGTDTGEANISQFSQERLKKYLVKLYVPIAQVANSFGMHVIMRPPGVCPGTIYVDGEYQKYLINVWDEVTKNDTILKYYKHISLELANEPVGIRSANGVEKDENLRDFFQPVIDKIRANGFKGIIWVPGTGWQASYSAYAKYPVVDPIDNLGFAVHNYAGWYNNRDDWYDQASNKTQFINNTIAQFESQVPVVRTNPVVITEVDWSPYNPEKEGHYDEHNNWVQANYGTWATANTSKWGKGYKATLDHYKNISMTLSGTDTYIDYASIATGKLKPAFPGVEEASGETCWKWYKEYAQVNYPSTERYQPAMVIPDNPLSLEAEYFTPTILHENTMTMRPDGSAYTISYKEEGNAGWRFEEPVDFSSYKAIVIKLLRSPLYATSIRIYDTHNFWADHAELKISGTQTVVNLEGLKTLKGRELDLKNIRLVTIRSVASTAIYIKDAFLSYDGSTPATAITSVYDDTQVDNDMYDLAGRIIKGTPKGFYIQGGKKYFNK